jgi:hypothetical protein
VERKDVTGMFADVVPFKSDFHTTKISAKTIGQFYLRRKG